VAVAQEADGLICFGGGEGLACKGDGGSKLLDAGGDATYAEDKAFGKFDAEVGPVHDGFRAIEKLLARGSAAAKKANVIRETSASEVGGRGFGQVEGKAMGSLSG
jgi:hypothetical protein